MPTDVVLTDKTRETVATLLQAARAVFESEGFDGASINQIVDRAGVARGTFYIYFPSKEDILETIAEGIETDIQAIQVGIDDPAVDSLELADELIRRAVRQFLRFYREHARMMAVLEQVATHDDRFRQLRRRMRRSAAMRAIGMIDRLTG